MPERVERSTECGPGVSEMFHPPTDKARVLIAGIGNIFLGDDAFGVVVAQRLLKETLPPEARVVDFGIRGLDLAYALQDGYELVILIDAAPQGLPPGTLYLFQPEFTAAPPAQPDDLLVETHNMDPAKVLRMVATLGEKGAIKQLLLVGCEPRPRASEDEMQMELSPPVQAAVEEAVQRVLTLTQEFLAENSQP
jgi:hydrogenase maturation protease